MVTYNFDHFEINGVAQTQGANSMILTVSADTTIVAYYTQVPSDTLELTQAGYTVWLSGTLLTYYVKNATTNVIVASGLAALQDAINWINANPITTSSLLPIAIGAGILGALYLFFGGKKGGKKK